MFGLSSSSANHLKNLPTELLQRQIEVGDDDGNLQITEDLA